ncbi:MAG TPA: Nif3-like dinuclear metal center hexameric protein [Nitrospirota bacterium]
MRKATLTNIAGFLNRTLRVNKIKDASVNGLQVRSRKRGEILRVGFAVDGCLSTFQKAKTLGVDLLVVHHGIKWRPQKDRELAGQRAAYLKKHNIALYAAHLPLDLHEEFGNNIQLCRMLDVREPYRFGRYHGVKIGYAGTFGRKRRVDAVASALSHNLDTTCRVFRFGKAGIRSIGIISGGGGSMLADASREQLDCFLVGEIDLAAYNNAKEYGMNLIVAGHYATETVGVRALMPLVRDSFNVETVFVDDPKNM